MAEQAKHTAGRPIYLAIMDAHARGAGLRLTAVEVHELAMDDAIAQRAAVCLEDDNQFITDCDFSWSSAYRSALAKAEGR